MDDWGTAGSRDTFRHDFTRPREARRSVGMPRLDAYNQREVADLYHRQRLVRRMRRVAKIAIIATRDDISSRKRQAFYYKRRLHATLHSLQENKYRIVSAGFVAVFALSTITPTFIQADKSRPIKLDRAVMDLIGATRDDSKDYLKYDSNKKVYSFEAPKQDISDTHNHTGRNADAYTTSLPDKASAGITVTETKTGIPVTLTPKFFISEARKSDGDHIVYQSGKKQVIYTHKYNGLKEDIILTTPQKNDPEFSFTLRLPVGAEARLDKDGNINIYSSDPTLFGDISYGSDADRSKIEKARDDGVKNNLVMSIPYPIVKDSGGNEYTTKAKFELGEKRKETLKQKDNKLPVDAPNVTSSFNTYTLTLHTSKLQDLGYPISVDPTIRVSSSADFNSLNEDSGASLDTTNNLIRRSPITGGAVNGWTQAATNPNTLPVAGYGSDIQFYNGYMYVVKSGSNLQYAPMNTDGSIGAFIDSGILVSSGSQYGSTVIYNGYMYIGTGTQIFYGKIKPDGSLSTFTSTNAFTTPGGNSRGAYATSAYNGYIYMSGGKYCTASCTDLTATYTTDVQYAKINPDGTLGTWASAGAAFSNGRSLHKSVVYNGFFYILGGWQGSLGSAPSNVQYAKISADGSLGVWKTTTAMPSPRTAAAVVVLSGYLYIIGGSDTIAATNYVPLYADGSLGTWAATDSITSGRGGIAGAVYGDIIYVGGGSSNNGGTLYADVQYASIKSAGESGVSTASGDFDTAGRLSPAAIAYNGYLYVTGGSTDNGTTFSSVIRKGTIGSDGSLSGWVNTTNTFSKARYQHSIAIYNNYLYIYGGYGNCGTLGAPAYCDDVQYASIGGTGDLSSFTTSSNSMLVGRAAFSGVMYNGVLYALGGRTSGGHQSDIDYAQIAADHSVGIWQNNPTSLSQPQQLHGATAYGGFIYVTGGYDGSNVLRTIQYAAINTSNGQVGAWTVINPGDVGGWGSDKYGHAVWAYNGYLYQAGGCGAVDGAGACTNGTNDLQFRKIQSDGTIAPGSWTLAGQSMSSDFEINIGWAISVDTVYFMGGRTDTATIHKDVNRTRLNNGGPGYVSPWAATASLNTARRDFVAGSWNDKVYVTSGCTDSGCTSSLATASTEIATVQPGGTLTSWSSGVSLPAKRYGATGTIVNGYMYVIGGADSSGNNTNTVYYAKLNSDGSFSTNTCNTSVTWCTTTNFPVTCTYADSVQFQSVLYVAGGFCNGGNKVYYAIFATDGSVVSWNSGTNLPYTSLWHGEVQAAGGRLYYLGGCEEASCVTYHDDAYYADINSNGSIGNWVKTTKFYGARSKAASVVANGYIYLFSGENNSNGQFAAILSSGALGPWQNTNMYTAALTSEIVMSGGRLYEIGGKISNPVNTVSYTSLNSIPRIAQISKLYDFDTGVKPTKLITRGSKQKGSLTNLTYSSSNNTANVLSNSQTTNDISYGGINAQTINLGTNRTLSQYLYISYMLDDSISGVFPDTGRESYITDFDMYYVANPGERLRGGRSFTNGNDRGLDAQPQ